jgi:hypothetical protein
VCEHTRGWVFCMSSFTLRHERGPTEVCCIHTVRSYSEWFHCNNVKERENVREWEDAPGWDKPRWWWDALHAHQLLYCSSESPSLISKCTLCWAWDRLGHSRRSRRQGVGWLDQWPVIDGGLFLRGTRFQWGCLALGWAASETSRIQKPRPGTEMGKQSSHFWGSISQSLLSLNENSIGVNWDNLSGVSDCLRI